MKLITIYDSCMHVQDFKLVYLKEITVNGCYYD